MLPVSFEVIPDSMMIGAHLIFSTSPRSTILRSQESYHALTYLEKVAIGSISSSVQARKVLANSEIFREEVRKSLQGIAYWTGREVHVVSYFVRPSLEQRELTRGALVFDHLARDTTAFVSRQGGQVKHPSSEFFDICRKTPEMGYDPKAAHF
jgi:hypothetical protein